MKKSKKDVLIVVGIVIFIASVFAQLIIARKATNNGLNGVIMQVQVLVSVLLVVIAEKKGLIASITLNTLNFLYSLIFVVILMKNYSSIPAVVAPLITIITCCIIHMYSSKVTKANEEVKTAYNELVETNKIIREKDEKLIYLAYYDVLTGLANRQLFVEQIDEIIGNNSGSQFTVILADIDDFKRIIDTYGHNTGDVLISTYSDSGRRYSHGLTSLHLLRQYQYF